MKEKAFSIKTIQPMYDMPSLNDSLIFACACNIRFTKKFECPVSIRSIANGYGAAEKGLSLAFEKCFLIVGYSGGLIRRFDCRTYQLKEVISLDTETPITFVAACNGTIFAFDSNSRGYVVKGGDEKPTSFKLNSKVKSIDKGETTVAGVLRDGSVFSVLNCNDTHVIKTESAAKCCVCIKQDRFVVGCANGSICFYDARLCELAKSRFIICPNDPIVRIHRLARKFLALSESGVLKIFTIERQTKRTYIIDEDVELYSLSSLYQRSEAIVATSNNKVLLFSYYNQTARIYDCKNDEMSFQFALNSYELIAISDEFSEHETVLCCISGTGDIELLFVNELERKMVKCIGICGCRAIACTSEHDSLCCTDQGQIIRFDAMDEKLASSRDDIVTHFDVCKCKKHIITMSLSGVMTRIDLVTGAILKKNSQSSNGNIVHFEFLRDSDSCHNRFLSVDDCNGINVYEWTNETYNFNIPSASYSTAVLHAQKCYVLQRYLCIYSFHESFIVRHTYVNLDNGNVVHRRTSLKHLPVRCQWVRFRETFLYWLPITTNGNLMYFKESISDRAENTDCEYSKVLDEDGVSKRAITTYTAFANPLECEFFELEHVCAVIGFDDGFISVIFIPDGSNRLCKQVSTFPITALQYDKNEHIYVACEDYSIRVFKLKQLTYVRKFLCHSIPRSMKIVLPERLVVLDASGHLLIEQEIGPDSGIDKIL